MPIAMLRQPKGSDAGPVFVPGPRRASPRVRRPTCEIGVAVRRSAHGGAVAVIATATAVTVSDLANDDLSNHAHEIVEQAEVLECSSLRERQTERAAGENRP